MEGPALNAPRGRPLGPPPRKIGSIAINIPPGPWAPKRRRPERAPTFGAPGGAPVEGCNEDGIFRDEAAPRASRGSSPARRLGLEYGRSEQLTSPGLSCRRQYMPAYTIADVDWHDEAKAAEYRKLLGPTLEKYGGRTLVANQAHLLEGDWNPRRVVIIEFPSMDALKTWYHSPEHAPVIQLRKDGAKTKMIAVERPNAP